MGAEVVAGAGAEDEAGLRMGKGADLIDESARWACSAFRMKKPAYLLWEVVSST